MSPRKRKQIDPLERAIETALSPGRFISHKAAWSFVDDVQDVADDIGKIIEKEPERAAHLFETFIAACHEKAGLDADWQAVVADVRERHFRKKGFMTGFEDIVSGAPRYVEPPFLDRAKARWPGKSQGG